MRHTAQARTYWRVVKDLPLRQEMHYEETNAWNTKTAMPTFNRSMALAPISKRKSDQKLDLIYVRRGLTLAGNRDQVLACGYGRRTRVRIASPARVAGLRRNMQKQHFDIEPAADRDSVVRQISRVIRRRTKRRTGIDVRPHNRKLKPVLGKNREFPGAEAPRR